MRAQNFQYYVFLLKCCLNIQDSLSLQLLISFRSIFQLWNLVHKYVKARLFLNKVRWRCRSGKFYLHLKEALLKQKKTARSAIYRRAQTILHCRQGAQKSGITKSEILRVGGRLAKGASRWKCISEWLAAPKRLLRWKLPCWLLCSLITNPDGFLSVCWHVTPVLLRRSTQVATFTIVEILFLES